MEGGGRHAQFVNVYASVYGHEEIQKKKEWVRMNENTNVWLITKSATILY